MKMYTFLILLFLWASCAEKNTEPETELPQKDSSITILSFNMWHGGDAGKQPLSKSIEVIRAAKAGIVGAQETHGYGSDNERPDNAEEMAGNMGWRHLNQAGRYGIMTKYQFTDTTTTRRGVKIKIDEDKYIWFFNCHLMYIPYQPYQLANKKYGDYPFITTEEEAVKFANDTRQAEVESYVKEIREVMKEGWPVVLTGDFNEPSHLDWTQRAAKANLCQIKVEWPSTKAFTDLGMKDAFRTVHPDEVMTPGKTWTSIDSPGEIHDRIDFIFYTGDQLKVKDAQTVGEPGNLSDIKIENYPSDHRAVRAVFEWVEK